MLPSILHTLAILFYSSHFDVTCFGAIQSDVRPKTISILNLPSFLKSRSICDKMIYSKINIQKIFINPFFLEHMLKIRFWVEAC